MEKETAAEIIQESENSVILKSLINFVLITFVSEETGQHALKAAQEISQLPPDKPIAEVVVS